ncbi:transposon Tf2-6 polyprotein [Trichonephila clavipes]|nr:transposon Tf2-6 polyprotein [Trichonephila clavipes]
MDSWLAHHDLKHSAAKDPPCREDRCTLNLSKLKHPPVGLLITDYTLKLFKDYLSSNVVVCERGVPFRRPLTSKVQSISRRGSGPMPFSIPLHPAGRREKRFPVVPNVAGRAKAGPRNNFQNAGAECTCEDYFHKDADSQLGGRKRYNDGTVESTDTIAILKTKIENSSTFESDPDFVKTLIQNCIDERVSRNEREVTLEKQKIELSKLQLAKLEKEIELQRAKNKALSLNPAAKVEEKQFETNIENMINSIRTLSLPVPTRSENFNPFFQSLERAFLTKKINDEYKSEILINLLGERAHNVLLYIKEEELNDYEKLKSIVLREFQLTPRECLNSFKNAVKSSGETYIQFAARLTANFQYYCSLRKVNSFESLCDLIISDKLFETLNKETATHIGIREAEDWFRPIDLAKECDIYISSKNGSHKEIPITYGYTEDPFKNRSQNFKPKIKENYPQYLERENKNCFICGDSSHYARDCEKRFKPKESNSHIHNRINVITLKVESEKQNSDEFANLQYVNIFVENQPVTALIDSGCQIPVLNSSLIRVQTPSEEIITLSSCFGEQRMVEVKPINLSLNQHSSGLSVRTAISPTLTEEIIIHPSVYTEIKKLGHAKSDVLLNESESSLGAHAYAYLNVVSVSNVIENSSYDLPYVKNFNTRNDLSSLIQDYKCNKIKSTKLKLSIIREKCSDIVLCKKVNGAMKTSSVEFISRSPTPSPMERNYRRFVLLRRIFEPWQWKRRKKRNRFEQTSRTLERNISMRSTKELIKKDVLMPVKHNVFLWNLPDVEEVPSHDGETV